VCRLSAATFVEAGVIASRDPTGAHRAAGLMRARDWQARLTVAADFRK